MGSKTDLRVYQFGMRAGERSLRPTNVATIDAASRRARRSRGDLYLILEALHTSELPDPLCHELITIIADTYYDTSGSITRSLRTALLAANEMLFERNLRADVERRCLAGLNCAVIRKSDVYIAQLGPALVSIVSRGEIVRYPSDSVWMRTATPSPFDQNIEPPAGLRRDIEPDLFHTKLSSGDVLILSTTDLARIASEDELTNAVTDTIGGFVSGGIESLAKGRDVTALVIQWPAQARVSAGEGRSSAVQQSDVSPPVVTGPPEYTSPAQPAVEAVQKGQEERVATLSAGEGPSVDQGHRRGERGDTDADKVRATGQRRQPPLTDLRRVRAGLKRGARRVRRSTEEFLLRVLPDAPPERPPEPHRREGSISLSGRAFVVLVLLIPFIVLFLVIMARVQYERIQKQYLEESRAQALSEYQVATEQQNRAAQRQGLYRALAYAEEALAVDPNDETMQTLTRRINHTLDAVDVVDRLYHFWQLAVLDDKVGGPTDSAHIIVRGSDLFLLNRTSDRVFKFLLNDVGDALQSVDGDPVLMRKGQWRGGMEIGGIVDIAWLEAGGDRTLSTFVALERGGSLLAYDPQQGIDVLPVADSARWRKPQAIGGYYGNLYILDPLLSRILKHVPTDNAYTNPPSDYLSPQLEIDLTGAVDVAIDGNLYLLFADGRILKFFNGEPQPFTMEGLPTPMRSPTTVVVGGPQDPEAEGYVYVTDAGNERIVQFNKDGGFVRQLQAKPGEPQLRNLRGIYVDEERGRIFILSGKTLWLADIPPLGGA